MQRQQLNSAGSLFGIRKIPDTEWMELTTSMEYSIVPKAGFTEDDAPDETGGSHSVCRMRKPEDHQQALKVITDDIDRAMKLPRIENARLTYSISVAGKYRGKNISEVFTDISSYEEFLKNKDMLPKAEKRYGM